MSRETAWAPCGLDIIGAKNIDEALDQAQLNFEVHKKNIYDEFGKPIPEWYRNVRSDNNSVLGIVSNKYKIVQNKDAFEFVNNLVAEGIEFEKGGIWKKGTAVWVEAKLPGEYKVLGDNVDSHVVFINSHDGKGAVKVCMVPNRLFCSNQLNFALKTAERMWSVVHSSKVDERIAEARETLGLADAYMKELAAEAEILANKKMSDEEFIKIIDTIYPLDENASNRKTTNVLEIKNGILNCLEAPDIANFKNTVWGALSAVTDYFDHCDPQRNTIGFNDARWQNVATGHRDVDKFYQVLTA